MIDLFQFSERLLLLEFDSFYRFCFRYNHSICEPHHCWSLYQHIEHDHHLHKKILMIILKKKWQLEKFVEKKNINIILEYLRADRLNRNGS